jgi:hypothetical protein
LIAEIAMTEFIKGTYDKVLIVYPQFVSTLVQKPNLLQILPFSTEADAKPGAGMSLRHYEGHILVVRLPRLVDQPQLAVQDHATWTSPWRIVTVGESADKVRQAVIAKRLP